MIETGIYFGDIHSYYDLDLVLSNVDIPPAKPKTSYIDVPGGNGSIDLTEAHGEVKFYDRDCKFTFTMNPAGKLSEAAFEEKKTEVCNLLNGKHCKITLDKDDEFYYLGRCTVDSFASDKRIRQIVISAKVKPYKFKQNETVLTFNLKEGKNPISIMCSRMSAFPTIECVSDHRVWMRFPNDQGTITQFALLKDILNKHEDVYFTEGINDFELRVDRLNISVEDENQLATVTFRFQEGVL